MKPYGRWLGIVMKDHNHCQCFMCRTCIWIEVKIRYRIYLVQRFWKEWKREKERRRNLRNNDDYVYTFEGRIEAMVRGGGTAFNVKVDGPLQPHFMPLCNDHDRWVKEGWIRKKNVG